MLFRFAHKAAQGPAGHPAVGSESRSVLGLRAVPLLLNELLPLLNELLPSIDVVLLHSTKDWVEPIELPVLEADLPSSKRVILGS